MMITSGPKSLAAIGFLTITRDPEHGFFGGYLVLNSVGRPLEFHCTAPVRPNRAQEILYGPTLEPYLYGERIGPTLLEKSKSRPIFVLTDVPAALAARHFVDAPLLWVGVNGGEQDWNASGLDWAEEQPVGRGGGQTTPLPGHPGQNGSHNGQNGAGRQAAQGGLEHFARGRYHFAIPVDYSEDRQVLESHWTELDGQLDLDEPFGRIREAIDEARSTAKHG